MSIYDDLIKHQIFLQRVGASNALVMRQHLNKATDKALVALKKSGHMATADLKALAAKIAKDLTDMVDKQLLLLEKSSKYEAKFVARSLEKNKIVEKAIVPTMTKSMVATTNVMLEADKEPQTVEKAHALYASAAAAAITQVISDSSLAEDGPTQAEKKFDQMNRGIFRSQTETLAKTAITATSAATRNDVYGENKVGKVRWVAILDESVCPDCEALNGTIYDVGEVEDGQEHWNCRCVMVPIDE